MRGARIEIQEKSLQEVPTKSSRPVRGARIEIIKYRHKRNDQLSRPVRGARIEIEEAKGQKHRKEVAPRAGRAD